MKNKIIIITIIIFLICTIVVYLLMNQNNETKIEAASAFYPYTVDLINNINGKESRSVDSIKMVSTSQAFSDLVEGKTDIIIATDPSDEQKQLIKNSNISIDFIELYKEPLAIIINKDNNIDKLDINKIQEIYTSINDWNTYQLEKNNGSQTAFETIVKNNPIGNNHYEINTMPKIIDKVAEDKNGIGYTFYSYYSRMHTNENAKIINVNNKDIKDDDYPLLFKVYLIYRKDKKEKVSDILNWIQTNEGKNG